MPKVTKSTLLSTLLLALLSLAAPQVASGGEKLLVSEALILLKTPAANGQGGDQGGTPASASLLRWGIGANGTLSSRSDSDVFRLDLQGRATVDVSSSGSTDTYGYLLDSQGRTVDDDDDSGADANFRMRETLDGGVYYLRVDSGGGTGDYRALARIVPVGDDHGDTPEASTLLPLNARVAGSITPSGDTDVFRIDLHDAALLRAYTRGSADTAGQLTDSGGQPVTIADSGGDGQNFRLESQVSPGIYYLTVTASGTGAYGVYAEVDEGGGGGGIQPPPPPADRLPAPVVEVTGARTFEMKWQWSVRAGETYAFDSGVRVNGGNWQEGCGMIDATGTGEVTVWVRVTAPADIQAGTVIDARYRYRNGPSCTSGSPGDWSRIGSATVSGDGSTATDDH